MIHWLIESSHIPKASITDLAKIRAEGEHCARLSSAMDGAVGIVGCIISSASEQTKLKLKAYPD